MNSSTIQLSDHFNYRRLLRFTLPSILMLVFTSIYSVVDGFFVSNFTGKTPFAAVNFIMPLLMILGCSGFMFGTGGGALIAKTMGVGDQKKANELFSLIVYVSAVCGVLIAIFGIIFLRPIASLMGAGGQLLENSLLRLGKCRFDGQSLLRSCTNGSSELMSNISMSAVSMLFNIQLMKYAAENGIAAYGVLISLILISVFSVLMLAAGQLLARPLSMVFVGYDADLMEMTTHAFFIFSFSFLLSGFAILGSSFFTALFLIGKQKKYHY